MPSRTKEFMARVLFNYSSRNWSYGIADLIYKYYLYPQLSGKQGLFHNLAKGQKSAPDVKHKMCCITLAKQITGCFADMVFFSTQLEVSFSNNGERAPFNTHLLMAKTTCLKSVYLIHRAMGNHWGLTKEGMTWSKLYLRGIKAEISKIENKAA